MRLAYWTGIFRWPRSKKMMTATTATISRPMMARSNAVMSPVLAFENMRTAASGISVTMPAKITSEIPLPMPRSVICSPSHMMKAVPVVSEIIVRIRKPQPGFVTTWPNCAYERLFPSSQRAMKNDWISDKTTHP